MSKSENETSLMTLSEVLSSVSGTVLGSCSECYFTSVETDSRNVRKDTLFVPLVGTVQDGHRYVSQAADKGASVILVNREAAEENRKEYEHLSEKGVLFVVVENTLYGLQNLAEGYVNKFPKLLKIGITGSCGKTTTKEMLVSVMKQKFNCVYTKGNFNSETGLPLSVFQIRKEHECGIFEMGMNRENEIGEISKVLKAEYALITNIGTAHIGILGNRENIAREKRKIFDYIPKNGAAFVPSDDDFASFVTENVKGKKVFFGIKVPEAENGARLVKENGLTGIEFVLDGVPVNLPVSGLYNYQNALGVAALAKELGLTAKEIKAGLESFRNVGGRMEVFQAESKNGKKITVVKDCYNANPDSMQKVIELCLAQKTEGSVVFVLGDMKELGDKASESHRKIIALVSGSDAEAAFVGTDFESEKGTAEKDFYWCETVEDEGLSTYVLSKIEEGSVLLLKGSNSMKLWNLLPEVIEIKEETE